MRKAKYRRLAKGEQIVSDTGLEYPPHPDIVHIPREIFEAEVDRLIAEQLHPRKQKRRRR